MSLRNMTPRQQAILDSFSYHRPAPEQAERIERNRLAFKLCALEVLDTTPEGADQTAALRQLHEAMMTANKAIVCEPGTPLVNAVELAREWEQQPPVDLGGEPDSVRIYSADDPNPGF